MRVLKAVFSILCALIIVFCSVAQFHHHSDDGHMVIFSYNCDSANHLLLHIIDNQNLDETETHKCSHGCHDGHQQEDKNCALKISIAKTEKKDIPNFIFCCDLFNELSGYILESPKTFERNFVELKYNFHKNGVRLMRAPPLLYNI